MVLQKSLKKLQQNAMYYEYKTMRGAVIAHFKHLKDLGMKPAM
jgi:linoleoyl-CoA desaturase